MDNEANQPTQSSTMWPARQAYGLAIVCLVVGLPVGYFLRSSAPPAAASAPAMSAAAMPPPAMSAPAPAAQAAAPAGMPTGMGQGQMPTMQQMKHMADKKAEPLLAKLKSDPKNATLLYQVANLYTDTHQFKDAIPYYQKALAIDPKYTKARVNMASCLYYTGNVDGALAELNKALTYEPKHPGVLMNIGIMKWKGQNDLDGAIAAWEKLLKLNPDFEQKAVVEHMIAEAKEQQAKAQSTAPPKG